MSDQLGREKRHSVPARLPREVERDVNDLLNVEYRQLDFQFEDAVNRVCAQASMHGRLVSGNTLVELASAAESSLAVRAQLSYNLLLRVLGQHGCVIDFTVRDACTEFLAEDLNVEVQHLTTRVLGSAPFRGNVPEPAKMKIIARIREKGDLEARRWTVEFRLAGAAAQRREKEGEKTMASSLTVNGPVGVLQTGPGSLTVGTVHIDAGARDALTTAVEDLLSRLAEIKDHPHGLEGVVQEVKNELAKPAPNPLLVTSLLKGVAAAISIIPNLRPSYEVIRSALALIGVQLP